MMGGEGVAMSESIQEAFWTAYSKREKMVRNGRGEGADMREAERASAIHVMIISMSFRLSSPVCTVPDKSPLLSGQAAPDAPALFEEGASDVGYSSSY